jgi:hypothetical protein
MIREAGSQWQRTVAGGALASHPAADAFSFAFSFRGQP